MRDLIGVITGYAAQRLGMHYWVCAVTLARFCVASVCVAAEPAAANVRDLGMTFRDFSSVNMAGDTERSLYRTALGMNRLEILWDHLEPEAGKWDQSRLNAYGSTVLRQNQNRVRMLVLLAYAARWSAEPGSQVTIGGHPAYISKRHIKHWVRYVERVVGFLRKPPYNVEYFQVWNEPWKHPQCGFWGGSDDEFFEHVYLPAAKAIRKLGGRVVYGGWPSCEDLSTWVALMNKHRAWNATDVLSFHYQSGWNSVWAWPRMRSAAISAGFPDIKIWTTEVGAIVSPAWFADWYTKLFYWAITNGGDRDRDLVKAFYFKEQSGPPGNYHFDRSFYQGTRLTKRGQALQVLADLFSGGPVRGYWEVENDCELSARIATFGRAASATESFLVASKPQRIVTAFQLLEDEFDPGDRVRLKYPSISKLLRAERIDVAGHAERLTVKRLRRGVEVTVSTANGSDSPARGWKVGKLPPFFVVLTFDD